MLHANLTRGLGLPAAEGACDDPPVHAGAGGRATRRGGRPLATTSPGCRSCAVAAQLGPAPCLRGPRARPDRLRPAGRRRAALSLSDTVRELKERGLLEVAVAVAPCHDGEVQAVTPASALGWACAWGSRAAVCAIGPGIVGTGTSSGMAASPPRTRPTPPQHSAVDPCCSAGLSGRRARAPPSSLAPHPCGVAPLPRGRRACLALGPGVAGRSSGSGRCRRLGGGASGCRCLHMGRGAAEDPWFFARRSGRAAGAGLTEGRRLIWRRACAAEGGRLQGCASRIRTATDLRLRS